MPEASQGQDRGCKVQYSKENFPLAAFEYVREICPAQLTEGALGAVWSESKGGVVCPSFYKKKSQQSLQVLAERASFSDAVGQRRGCNENRMGNTPYMDA